MGLDPRTPQDHDLSQIPGPQDHDLSQMSSDEGRCFIGGATLAPLTVFWRLCRCDCMRGGCGGGGQRESEDPRQSPC